MLISKKLYMNGFRQLVIIYPGYISLPENNPIFFVLNEINVFASVLEHIEVVQIVDFRNALKKNRKGKVTLRKSIKNFSDNNFIVEYKIDGVPKLNVYEYKLDSEKVVSTEFYTIFTIAYEISDVKKISDEENNFADLLLNEFIHSYKHIAKDSRIRLPNDIGHRPMIIKEALIEYSEEEKKKSVYERMLSDRELHVGIKTFTAFNPKESLPQETSKIAENYRILQKFFYQGNSVKPEFRLLSKAYEELDLNRNYKYSFLESFIVAEGVISKVLRQIKLSKGVSNKKLKDFEKDLGISYQINIELPLLLENITNSERQILGDIDKVRKIRNDVVHNNASVSEETAIETLNSVQKLLDLFIERKLI